MALLVKLRFFNVNKYLDRYRHYLIASFILITLVIITYWSATKNNFIDWDDYQYVVNNDLVRDNVKTTVKDIFITPVSWNYHPLTILSLRLNNNSCDTCPDGISPKPFIRTNVIIHILNSILVLTLIYLLTKKNIIASFFVAAVFSVHPMHVESVAWISERKDVLYSFFFLSGLISYLFFKKFNKYRALWLGTAFILFVLSCLSKATAVMFPLVIILINFWLDSNDDKYSFRASFKNTFSFRSLSILLPFFLVSLFFGIMAYKIQNGQNFLGLLNLRLNSTGVVNIVHPFSFFQRVGIASYGFIVYILKFIIPVNIFLYYPYPEISEFTHGSFYFSLILSFLGVLLILGFTLYSLKRSKLFLMGLGFYFLSIVLVLQFISVGLAIIATRYTYLPYIGLAFIPAVYISKTKGKKMFVLLGVFSLFILMNMFLSIKEVRKWNNTETLWFSLIEKYPHIEIPRRSRAGYYYIKASRTNDEREKRILEDKALLDFNELIATKTKSPDVFEGIAMIYERRNNFTSALQYINQAIVLDPARARTYYNRALIYDDLNQKENAINDYGTALRLSPDMTIQILSNKSVLLIETKRFAEAIKDLDLLIKIKPDDPRFYCNRAFSKIQLNDISGAKNDYLVAFKLDPKNQTIIKQLQILESIESK